MLLDESNPKAVECQIEAHFSADFPKTQLGLLLCPMLYSSLILVQL